MTDSAATPRFVFVIPSLQSGGAEFFAIRLLNELQTKSDILLILLKSFETEVDVSHLNKVTLYRLNLNQMTNVFGILFSIIRFARKIRSFNPIAVQCFLYPAELISLVLFGKFKVFWSLRSAGYSRERNIFKRLAMRFDVFLSKYYPHKIVACSSAAADWAINLGVPMTKLVTINNFLDDWTYDARSKSKLLNENRDLMKEGIRIGMAARLDKNKGYDILVEGVHQFCEITQVPVELTFIGRDTDLLDQVFEQDFKFSPTKGLIDIELCGEILDSTAKAQWFSSLDLYVLASKNYEGFPNSLAEAISIGCPAISTDSGNSREFLHDNFIVQQANAESISSMLKSLLLIPTFELKGLIEVSRAKVLSLTNREEICDWYLEEWMN